MSEDAREFTARVAVRLMAVVEVIVQIPAGVADADAPIEALITEVVHGVVHVDVDKTDVEEALGEDPEVLASVVTQYLAGAKETATLPPLGHMTKTEQTLHKGANYNKRGSGDALVHVYRCAKTLLMAATINCYLKGDAEEGLASMREQVDAMKSSRNGPKADRHATALAALAQLGASS